MNIEIIQENIDELENADTTFEAVQELAYLYIIRNNLSEPGIVKKELADIVPAYQKYVAAKRRFQLGEIDDEPMIKTMQLLCMEIKEFVLALYSGTGTRKERIYIEETVSSLFSVFENSN